MRQLDTPLDFDDNDTEEVELNLFARKSAVGIKTKVNCQFAVEKYNLKKVIII